MRRYTIETIKAPTYAQDGSRGYALTIAHHYVTLTDKTPTPAIYEGWVTRADNGRVIATIDHYPWEYVTDGLVPDDEWSESWVSDNAAEILGIYGWSVR